MSGEPILVVADEYYSSLATVRGLRAGGYEPWVASTVDDSYAARSRAAAGTLTVPDPRHGAEPFVAAVAAAASRTRAAAVLAGTEAATLALSDRGDDMPPGVALGVPPRDGIRRAYDKRTLADLAAAAGLESPPHELVDGHTLGGRLETLGYPVVVKPIQNMVLEHARTTQLAEARPARTPADLRELVGEDPDREWIVQPLLAGRLMAVAGVVWKGRVHCTVHQVAHRTYPLDCGVSAFAETLAADRTLDAKLQTLLGTLGLSGIFQVQFIAAGSSLNLIDLNPRPYGSMGLALAAGANLPAAWADLVLGREPRPCDYRAGVRFRAEMRELGALRRLVEARRMREALALLVPRRRTAHAVLSLRDPGPAALLARRTAVRAGAPRLRRDAGSESGPGGPRGPRSRLRPAFRRPGGGKASGMRRDSTEHGPRLDDELEAETESLVRGAPVEARVEGWREQEGGADGEREPSARTRAQGRAPDEFTERSELSRHLRLSVFPAGRDALLREAEANDAPANVVEDLRALPADVTFGTVHEVWAALGGTVETVAGRPLRPPPRPRS